MANSPYLLSLFCWFVALNRQICQSSYVALAATKAGLFLLFISKIIFSCLSGNAAEIATQWTKVHMKIYKKLRETVCEASMRRDHQWRGIINEEASSMKRYHQWRGIIKEEASLIKRHHQCGGIKIRRHHQWRGILREEASSRKTEEASSMKRHHQWRGIKMKRHHQWDGIFNKCHNYCTQCATVRWQFILILRPFWGHLYIHIPKYIRYGCFFLDFQD